MARRTTSATSRKPAGQLSESPSERKAANAGRVGIVAKQLVAPVAKTKKATILAGRLLPIAAHSVAVFGDEHKAAHWFATPLALLGNRSPEEVFDDKGGAEIVDRILSRIEHNIPS